MDEEEIENYTAGTCLESEIARMDEHLLLCEPCQERVKAGDNFAHGMRAAAEQLRNQSEAETRRAWWPRFVPVMAAVLLALVAWQLRRDPDRHSSVFAVSLATVRGSNPAAHAPSGIPLHLRLDLSALPSFPAFQVSVVNASGYQVWQGPESGGECSIPALSAGTYFVRVSSPAGELLREYGLEISGR